MNNNKKYEDKRGSIAMILEECNVQSISRIISVAGSTRANHWHKKDGHTILVNKGCIYLYERVKGQEEIVQIILWPGDQWFTGPNIEHTMYFPELTEFDCYSLLPRNTENYEEETVRFDYSLRDLFEEQRK